MSDQKKESDVPSEAIEGPENESRRDFLRSLGRWSAIVIGGVALGGLVEPTETAGWINGGGGAAWVNARGGGGAAWVNGAGGGGAAWVNRAGGWVNGAVVGGGGGGAWVNNRGGGGAWVNRRY